ncbi:peptide chain release factor N(5)-glutamine methyltransferase [Methylosarcina fibrata]|uniref:peptide chain release factor N(5)-glutamine methyltransferase n=1 Tax=Methylosarcina fibrata TaxID=105972 RepID=UPI00037316E2|nr:peptide chain release factor N(5)-glutamine methyltransferase [Methylosarcina fibrata]
MNSIESALREAAADLHRLSESPRLEAEILLAETLGKARSHLRAWPEHLLSEEQTEAFRTLVRTRQQGIPLAYLTGTREFWSRDFIVTPDVLIPRPETELLIELSLQRIPDDRSVKVIDLGTGSGIIAITLAAERPLADVVAVDFSLPALSIAQRNAEKHRIRNVRFCRSDWFADVPDTQFDLIVSNPPYIAENDGHLEQGDLRFEPKTSLCAPEQGLADIRRIADTARARLVPGGHLLIEHGYDQKQAAQSVFKAFGYAEVETCYDLSGQPRVTYGRYGSSRSPEPA